MMVIRGWEEGNGQLLFCSPKFLSNKMNKSGVLLCKILPIVNSKVLFAFKGVSLPQNHWGKKKDDNIRIGIRMGRGKGEREADKDSDKIPKEKAKNENRN